MGGWKVFRGQRRFISRSTEGENEEALACAETTPPPGKAGNDLELGLASLTQG